MAQLINVDTDDNLDQVFNLTLEGTLYVFRLRYTDRCNWQMAIYDPLLYNFENYDNTEAKLYGERKLMTGQNFLKYTHGVDTLPRGAIYLYDTEEKLPVGVELPDRYNLGVGNRFVLMYLTESEVFEINASGGNI